VAWLRCILTISHVSDKVAWLRCILTISHVSDKVAWLRCILPPYHSHEILLIYTLARPPYHSHEILLVNVFSSFIELKYRLLHYNQQSIKQNYKQLLLITPTTKWIYARLLCERHETRFITCISSQDLFECIPCFRQS
jgi:hypothetical protein